MSGVHVRVQAGGNRPDVVLYSVAMRTAAALDQGIEKMETVYHDCLAEGHRPDLLMLNRYSKAWTLVLS